MVVQPRTAAKRDLDSIPLNLVYYFSVNRWFGSPPSPPSKIHPGSLPSAIFPHPLSFPPIASSPYVFVQSAVHLQQPRWSPVIRPSEVYIPPVDFRPMPCSWFPVQRRMKVCPPPRPVRLVVLGSGVGGAVYDTAPPVMVLSFSTR